MIGEAGCGQRRPVSGHRVRDHTVPGARPVIAQRAHLVDHAWQPAFAEANVVEQAKAELSGETDAGIVEADVEPRLGLYVHHTDAEREWAYDRNSSIGKLDKGLDAAPKNVSILCRVASCSAWL